MNNAVRKTINCTSLLNNVNVIKSHLKPKTKIMAVVKQNAYGHGLENAIPIIKNHVDAYAVATLSEAQALRSWDAQKEILVLSPPTEDTLPEYERLNCSLAISDADHFDFLGRTNQSFHVQIDTGMNRLGIDWREAAYYASKVDMFKERFLGVYSHFANADEVDDELNAQQIDRFSNVQSLFPDGLRHMCNSDGTLHFPQAHFSMIRPGLLFWGYGDHPELQPVMKLSTHVIQSKFVRKNEGISYGSSYVAELDHFISILAIGYGEGLSRLFSNKLIFQRGEHTFPVVGNVTMDYVIVSTGQEKLAVGTELFLPNAREMADAMRTIPYEILCVMGNLVGA